MKKITCVLALIILLGTILYLSQSFFGFNITLSELFGSSRAFIKNSPEGIQITHHYILKPYITNLKNPRFMAITPIGDLILAEPYEGKLLLIPYNKPEQSKLLLSGLNKPHSMDIYKNYLYVAEENAIGRIPFNSNTTTGNYQQIINLPDDGGHWTRTIKFDSKGYGYVSIGSSCNVCIEKSLLRAAISRFKPEDKQLAVFATGLRNAVGFDWDLSGKLYATENGRDFLGDNFPPDELNVIEENQFYGWPYANGQRVPDPDYGPGQEAKIQQSKVPVFEFGAHNAPLGLTFVKNPNSPLYHKALVALHGSWNSSVKVGYKVVILSFENNKITQEDFITGFEKQGKVVGRPVQIVEGKNDEFYLSDDYNGIIYKIELATKPHQGAQ